MFIDIHAHAYRIAPPPWPVRFCTPDELLRRYDDLQIEKGVLLPIVSPEVYIPQSNEDILEICQRHPDRFIPFCNVDPRALTNSPHAPLDRLLHYYKDRGCRGLGEVMPNLELMDPRVQNLFRHAESVGLPVIFDGAVRTTGDFGLYDDPGLPQLEWTLQCFPNLIILGHGPLFWSEIGALETPGERGSAFCCTGGRTYRRPSGPIEREGVVPILMRRYPNLYGDLSDLNGYNALARDPDYGPRFLTEFQDRLLFGTDICHPDQPVPLVDLLISWRDTGKISAEVFNKIARGNAMRLLGIDG